MHRTFARVERFPALPEWFATDLFILLAFASRHAPASLSHFDLHSAVLFSVDLLHQREKLPRVEARSRVVEALLLLLHLARMLETSRRRLHPNLESGARAAMAALELHAAPMRKLASGLASLFEEAAAVQNLDVDQDDFDVTFVLIVILLSLVLIFSFITSNNISFRSLVCEL